MSAGSISTTPEVSLDPLRTALESGRKEQVDALQWTENQFVEPVTANVPPNHETIITRNETGEWADESTLVDLEAGANRCAVGSDGEDA